MPKVVRINDWDEEERPPLEDDGKKRPPPGSRKGKAPKKGKKAPPAVKTRTSSRKRSPEGEGGASGTEEEPSEASDADSHSSKSTSKSSSSSASTSRRAVGVPIEEITPEQMQEIAEFYEGHPMYYDVGHENHKNTKLKDWTLDKFSEQIGLSVQAIQRHFTSCRTEHFKLKNRPKSGKSGSWAAPLTSLQKFKLKAYEFLDAHHILLSRETRTQ
ncbi:uncharacterized protein LOC121427283 [Lytechinus variegatus]|uniref:uncharacterized protein LOC121427283 n=1 Tax=Lytechinus variegatus TaxID=7654 RepID=UPI001BB2976B|nr:uncharacterized protein LOC121427283 [Lytechinus variegatus]